MSLVSDNSIVFAHQSASLRMSSDNPLDSGVCDLLSSEIASVGTHAALPAVLQRDGEAFHKIFRSLQGVQRECTDDNVDRFIGVFGSIVSQFFPRTAQFGDRSRRAVALPVTTDEKKSESSWK